MTNIEAEQLNKINETTSETSASKTTINLSRIALATSAMIALAVSLFVIFYKKPVLNFVILGMGRGNVYPTKGKFEPHKGRTVGGYETIATMIQKRLETYQKKKQPSFTISLGTELVGSAEALMTEGEIIVEAFNTLGVEAMLLSNIDFTYGVSRLKELKRKAKFPFIATNVSDENLTSPPFYSSYAVVKPSGILFPSSSIKVAFLGITPVDTPNLTPAENIEGLTFHNPANILSEAVQKQRSNGANLVVLMTQYSREYITNAEWQAIAKAAPDICFMLDHAIEAPRPYMRDGILVSTISAYNRTYETDFLAVEIEPFTGKISNVSYERLPNDSAIYEKNPKMTAMLASSTVKIASTRDEIIGYFANSAEKAYKSECPIGNFITDIMRETTSTDIAFQNSGSIRSSVNAGAFTYGDLCLLLPFDNNIVEMELTGEQIMTLLRKSLHMKRGLLQVSGLRYKKVPSEKPHNFEIEVTLDNETPFELQTTYKVVTNSFLAGGGDLFQELAEGKNIKHFGSLREALKKAIETSSPEAPITLKTEGRIFAE